MAQKMSVLQCSNIEANVMSTAKEVFCFSILFASAGLSNFLLADLFFFLKKVKIKQNKHEPSDKTSPR